MKSILIWYRAKTFKFCRKLVIFTSHWYEQTETPKMLSEKASRVIAVVNNWNSCLANRRRTRHIEHRVDAIARLVFSFFFPILPV